MNIVKKVSKGIIMAVWGILLLAICFMSFCVVFFVILAPVVMVFTVAKWYAVWELAVIAAIFFVYAYKKRWEMEKLNDRISSLEAK